MNTIAPTASLEEISFDLLEDRYSRQRLIASWNQDTVAQASILVAGAGALGNEVLKNLALLGVGKIVIVDFDRIEISNLSRSVLFREEDIGQPKASTAARALRRLNPEIQVHAIDGDLECDLGLGRIRDCDLVLGCLDSIYARWVLNRACRRAGRPWINAGINATVGEISLFVPGAGPCYECGMTLQMWRQIHERRSCMLLPKKMAPRTIPATAIIASLTAALQVNEAMKWIHGSQPGAAPPQDAQQRRTPETPQYRSLEVKTKNGSSSRGFTHASAGVNRRDLAFNLQPEEMLVLSLDPYSLSSIGMKVKADCMAHETYVPTIFVDAHPADITVAELLEQIPVALALQTDFDVLESWLCANCGEERVGRRVSKKMSEQLSCPQCGAERRPQLVHEIQRGDWLAHKSLAALGLPRRSILRVETKSGIEHVELAETHQREGNWQPSPSRS